MRPRFEAQAGKIPWRRERLPAPVLWPGEFHGLYSLWGSQRVGHDWVTFTSFHFSNFFVQPILQISLRWFSTIKTHNLCPESIPALGLGVSLFKNSGTNLPLSVSRGMDHSTTPILSSPSCPAVCSMTSFDAPSVKEECSLLVVFFAFSLFVFTITMNFK